MGILLILLMLLCFATTLFPDDSSAVSCTFPTIGSTAVVPLTIPFTYGGISRNGFLAFENPAEQDVRYKTGISEDVIAPLWTSTKRPGADVKYSQVSSGELTSLATHEINTMFPEFPDFNANWVLVVTWKVETESSESLTFQAVLASSGGGGISIIMFNYVPVASLTEYSESGFKVTGKDWQPLWTHVLTVMTTTNVQIPGRWAFAVHDEIFLCFSYNDKYALIQLPPGINNGYSPRFNLSVPFNYFRRS